ncbi:MAG: CotH kinase family protein [Crocinitomicaceae bacterium]|nr:CotH kinase family protein [Crocinitomicaceae bacterium]
MKSIYPIVCVCLIVGFGCTKFSVEETLPDITNISPNSMNSELDRINIVADVDSFDYMYTFYGGDTKISASVEYYTKDGILLFEKNAKINIKGAGSANNPMKSIGIVFDDKVNNSAFQIIETSQALPNDNLNQLQSIRLRNSGNDDGVTHLKDLSLTELAIRNSIDLELKYGKAVHAFVNGDYYGLLNLRTEVDRIGLSDLLGVNIDDITIMKMDTPNDDLDFREGDEQVAQALIDAIEAEDGYALHQLVDIDNFIDYLIYEDYVGNIDWPQNNVRLYSLNGNKFRFLLYDLDGAATRNRAARLPKMEYLEDDVSKMYQILRNHDQGFIQTLEERQAEIYGVLSTTKFNTIVDELSENIHVDIGYLIQKWGAPTSTLQWLMNVDKLKQDFHVNEFYNRKLYELD